VNSGHVRSKIGVDQNVMSKRKLFNQDLSAELKNPSGRGKRLIVVLQGAWNFGQQFIGTFRDN
jgi:hypothetical protein